MGIKVWNDGADKAFVFGRQFGPCLVAITDSRESAFDEWDEQFGRRVDPGDPDLGDYGSTPEEQLENAMSDGDIRINDGGTIVWADPHEWVREFPTIAAAFAFAFGIK